MTHKAHQPPEKPIRIVFFGTPDFAVPALRMLAAENDVDLLVITSPARPAGRGQVTVASPIQNTALELRLPLIESDSPDDPELRERIKDFKPDLFIVAAYGKILPASLLSLSTSGAVNIHPSLLPKFRGASPIEHALLSGERETGVTLIMMDEQIDHGPILSQEVVPITSRDTRLSLSLKLAEVGARMLAKTYKSIVRGLIQPQEQDNTRVTLTKLLGREDGRLYWNRPAAVLERQVRAFIGRPDSFCVWQRNGVMLRIKVIESHLILGPTQDKSIGLVWQAADSPIAVYTIDGSLGIDRLCIEGKSPTTSAEFVNGYPDIVGALLL